jgi:hypothetical protein
MGELVVSVSGRLNSALPIGVNKSLLSCRCLGSSDFVFHLGVSFRDDSSFRDNDGTLITGG